MQINFSDLPGQPNIFLDFLYEFEKVKDYYAADIRNIDNLENKFNEILENYSTERVIIQDIISGQYEDCQISPLTKSNLKFLGDSNTITLTTGQQVGIFTGPLYTIYKAITTIKLAEYLKLKYENFNFVPIFWLAGDDHDFEEVRSLNLIDAENNFKTVTYSDGLEDEANRGSVGNLEFNENIETVIAEIEKILRPTEFTAELMNFIRSCYNPEQTFASSFKKMMMKFFDEYGLLIIDATDARIKELLKPVFLKEIGEFGLHTNSLVSLSAELEELYHAQVKVKPVNLFMNYDGGRHLIEPIDEEFRLKGKRKRFTKEELLDEIAQAPENFSPNVLLRPVCQDYLFPNAFYIGGPGEISYYAQLQPLYEFYSIPYPIVYPRSSATLLENNSNIVLNKFGLELNEVFVSNSNITNKIVEILDERNFHSLFENSLERIDDIYSSLENELLEIDKTLSDVLEKNKQRTLQNFQALRDKVDKAQARRYENSVRQINKVKNLLYPNENLQERELNIIYFLNKYGMDFIKQLYSQLGINRFTHQIIEI